MLGLRFVQLVLEDPTIEFIVTNNYRDTNHNLMLRGIRIRPTADFEDNCHCCITMECVDTKQRFFLSRHHEYLHNLAILCNEPPKETSSKLLKLFKGA